MDHFYYVAAAYAVSFVLLLGLGLESLKFVQRAKAKALAFQPSEKNH